MFRYFGYGSNLDLTSLRAKGVEPRSSVRARLPGWTLAFDVQHWFAHEGGVGNIHPSDAPGAEVRGLVHECEDEHLAMLDAVESYGVGYDRIEVELETEVGRVRALTYVGLPSYLNAACLPTRRYLNIILRGAARAGLDAAYVARLREHPIHVPRDYPPWTPPVVASTSWDARTLAAEPKLTALCGAVFDMSDGQPRLECLHELFGGRDTTLFHLKRLDESDGSETIEDVLEDRLSEGGRRYLNAYLHEYDAEFRYVGRFEYRRGGADEEG